MAAATLHLWDSWNLGGDSMGIGAMEIQTGRI